MTHTMFYGSRFSRLANKANSCFLLYCSLIIFASCGNDEKPTAVNALQVQEPQAGDSAETPGKGGGTLSFNNKLYTHYIGNLLGNEQLRKLVGDKEKKQKFVFQFFRDSSGHLRLIIFPGKKKNEDFVLGDTVMAIRSEKVDTTLPDTGNIFLGDLQLTDNSGTGGVLKKLTDSVYNPQKPGSNTGWEYIWFVPEIKPITEGSFRGTYVVYHIEHHPTIPQASSVKAASTLRRIGVTNPSPPATIE